ncbi:MAG TPA: T9SS type A sorting domain-containing protein [Bacteroidetes bacterium]|nr:T9SS type A sorting domain-containing protein [Bacteroidota bacterium]
MCHFYRLLAFSLILSMPATGFGQISFTDHTSLLHAPPSGVFSSGNVIGIADMNGDGYDDIVRMKGGSVLNIEYQIPDSAGFTHFLYGHIPEKAWAMVLGDVNNDGYNDIMVGGYYDGVKLLTATANGTSYLQSDLPGADLFVQGSNMADINNDGFLDIFACHDDGESFIWRNLGNGLFAPANNWIDMTTVPPSDNSGNYGSVWTDFDNDGDLDLYIAKCRIGVNDPADPRRINALFLNDGNNNYTEAAAAYNLKIGHQSWTADFQDIDNDGDLDCFITNHDYNLQLLENDGTGYFTDISVQAGITTAPLSNYVQGIMKDFDNDGFVDIITSQPTVLFHNNGDKTFTQTFSFTENFGSLAVGDLNHDGFIDLYTAYQDNFNTPSGIPDKLWINDGNDNHFLCVRLSGSQSNRMGVGARIEAYGPWGIQVREVRAGESYGISNTLTQTFGLGAETQVEYLVVKWPSGTVDMLRQVQADQFLTIEEGSTCSLPPFQLTDESVITLCNQDSLLLSAPDGYLYFWNDGTTQQSVMVRAPGGHFSVTIMDSLGCIATSPIVKVHYDPDQTPTLIIDGDTRFCEGGSVDLTAPASDNYQWSNGAVAQTISVNEPGSYYLTVHGVCADFTSDTVVVEVLQTAAPPTADDVYITAPSIAILTATGEHPHWYESADAPTPLYEGSPFETPVLTDTTTYYVADAKQYGSGNFTTGMTGHQGSLFSGDGFNGQILFQVFEKIILHQVTVGTDLAAIRLIELRDLNDEVVESLEINLPAGESVIDLNFTIEPGFYKLTTNTNTNLIHLGTESPRLYRSDEGVQYPYVIPDVLTITNSNFGSGFYYYFYKWQVERVPKKCFSQRVPVTVYVLPNATNEAISFGHIAIAPNPSHGQFLLKIQPSVTGTALLTLTDMTGKKIWTDRLVVTTNSPIKKQLDLTGVPAGIYFLQITDKARESRIKVVIE